MRRARPIVEELAGGDLRSIGKSDTIVRRVLRTPALFRDLIAGMSHADPIVRARCADAAEKATKTQPSLLAHHTMQMLHLLATSQQQEVRWHVAQMLPRMALTSAQRRVVTRTLGRWLAQDRSTIVRVFALQALADFAMSSARPHAAMIRQIRCAAASKAPALVARAKQLTQQLQGRFGAARKSSRESGRRAS